MAANPDFTSIRTSAPAGKFSNFWRWWVGELANLVPERISMLGGGARAPMLAFEGDVVRLLEPRGSAAGEEATIVLSALDETRRKAAVRALLERAGETRARARLALGRDEALVRRVTLPAATEENLAQVLAFEMDRLTPFKAEDVYFDYRVISRDPTAGQVVVQVAIARRDLVDAQVAKLRALGISVQGVAVRDDVGHPAAPLDLMPREQRGERESSRERTFQWLLLGAVILLLVTALLLPVVQKREVVKALLPLQATARQAAEATDAIARELERQVGDYNFLLVKKHGIPILAFTEEISRLLPDNTWLSQLDVRTTGKTREVTIAGETASASKLIEILEQSTLLQNAALRGSVTRGSQPGLERFQIVAEVRPKAQPEPRPVMEAVSMIPPPPPQPAPAPPAAAPAPATAVVTPVPMPPAAPSRPDAKAPAKAATPGK